MQEKKKTGTTEKPKRKWGSRIYNFLAMGGFLVVIIVVVVLVILISILTKGC